MTAVLLNFKDDFRPNKPDERLCSSKRVKKSLNSFLFTDSSLKGQKKATVSWRTPNRVNIK